MRSDNRLSPSAAKHIFTVKSIFLPVSAFAFIGGLVHLAGGSLDLTIVNPVKPASNAAFSWAFLQGLNAIFGVSRLHFFRFLLNVALISFRLFLWVPRLLNACLCDCAD